MGRRPILTSLAGSWSGNTDLPVVPIGRGVSPLIPAPNHHHIRAIPLHQEGRLAIVTDAGRDAVDAKVLVTMAPRRTAKS